MVVQWLTLSPYKNYKGVNVCLSLYIICTIILYMSAESSSCSL